MLLEDYQGDSKVLKAIAHILNRKAPLPLDTDGDAYFGTNGQVLKTDGTGSTYWDDESGGGDSVSWTQLQSTGTKIAEIDINGTSTDVYAPNGGGGGGGHTIWNRIKTALTSRSNLWFADAKVSDISADDATKVEVLTELADETAFDNLPTDGTADGMYAFPDSGAEYLTPQMVGFNSISFTANTQGNGAIELPGAIQDKVVVGFQITSIPSGYGEAGGWLLKSTNGKYYFMCKDASGSAVANKQVGITFFYY